MIKDLLLDDSSDRVVINLKDNSILVDLDDNNGQTDETLSGIARVLLYEREIEGLEFFLEAPHPNTLPQSSVQEAIIGALRYLALKGLTKGSIGASQFHTMNALSAPTTTCVAKISLDSAHPKTAFITIKVSERR
ncbi:MAG: hypothetical protein HQ596_08270 [Candidatus Saganbacteria bacterium]|nr:hypothetical protein [Candidatus Saganbacteria bacterium]